MSWWIYVGDDDRNVTYNVAGMFDAALGLPEKLDYNPDGSPRMCQRKDPETGAWVEQQSTVFGIRLLDEAPASEAAGVLSRAVERMKADPDTYKAMNPPNGWGSYDTALADLEWMLDRCIADPTAKVMVH